LRERPISQVMAKKNAGQPLAQTLHLNAHELLVWTNRETSGDGYRRLKEAFERLSGTRITTNIKAHGEEITEGFGLIDSWRVVRQTKSGRMSEISVRLAESRPPATCGRISTSATNARTRATTASNPEARALASEAFCRRIIDGMSERTQSGQSQFAVGR
jgi:plasmid replication initiation protein